jgi:hypothetical protein
MEDSGRLDIHLQTEGQRERTAPTMRDSGERRQFETGAVRDRGDFKPRPDLISPHANLREGAWLAKGAEKYQPRNWEKGMPISECVASLSRHLEAYKLGLRDEDHMAAIRTNAGFILHYEEEIKAGRLDPALDNMPHYPQRTVPWPLHLTRECGPDVLIGGPVPPTSSLSEQIAQEVESINSLCNRANRGDLLTAREHERLRTEADKSCVGQRVPDTTAVQTTPIDRLIQRTIAEDDEANLRRVRDEIEGETTSPCWLHTLGPSATCRVCRGLTPNVPPEEWNPPFRPTSVGERRAKPFTVYLCGPITGQAVDHLWREAATAMLNAHGIRTLDPLRGKDRLAISNQGMNYEGELASVEMADRDRLDVEEADMILAHFPYAPPRQSIGSLMEMGGAAIGLKKPIILCTELPEFNAHLFTRKFCILQPDFEEALRDIVAIATKR